MTLVRQGHPDEIAALRDWERRMREGFGFTEDEAQQAGAKYMPPAVPSHLYRQGPPTHLYRPPQYRGPDLFDVAPPGVHALLAFRNVHRFTGVLDGTPLAVQE